MKFKPFEQFIPSLQTHICKLSINTNTRLFQKICKKATKQLSKDYDKKFSLRKITHEFENFLRKVDETYKIIDNREEIKEQMKKYNKIVFPDTDCKISICLNRQLNKCILKRVSTRKGKRIGFFIPEQKLRKRRTHKKFNHMSNQVTFKGPASDRVITIMCFANLSLTLTGCKKDSHGPEIVDRILELFPEFYILQDPWVAMTTYHFSYEFDLDLADLGIFIQNKFPNNGKNALWVNYDPDVYSYLKIYYAKDTKNCSKFIIRKSGKIMQSSPGVSKFMKPAYEILIESIIEYIKYRKESKR